MNIRTIFKITIVLLIFLLAGIATAVSFRNKLCMSLVCSWTKGSTGLELSVEELNIDLLHNTLSLKGITLLNPPGFKDETFGKIREIFINYDLISFLRRKRPHFHLIKADISEINIIRNEKGESNTVFFARRGAQASIPAETKEVLPAQKEKAKNKGHRDDDFLIDRLAVSLGKATFMDYTASEGEPAVIIFSLERPCMFKNVRHLAYVIHSISTKGGFKELLTPEEVFVKKDLE